MNSDIARQCLPVAQFFARINWQGLEVAQIPSETKIGRAVIASPKRKLDPTSPQAMCLSVGEFFSLYDWQGETVDRYIYTDTDSDGNCEPEEAIVFSLTLPVRQLFSLVAWDGRTELIAPTAKQTTASPQPILEEIQVDRRAIPAIVPPADNTEISLNDLSNLF